MTALRERPDPAVAPSTSGLRLESLTVSLGGRVIVPPLDLDIARGELVCLLGPSGCGKTTTLRMIGGFLAPDSGRILIGDRDWASAPPERRPTAMVFQNYALWPHMSVERNVAYPLATRRMPRAERNQKVAAALDMVGLGAKAGRRPARLSGGEQQRVALARALVQRPEILLLDEPLSNLDAKLRVQVREDIRAIQQELGITSVFVTHDQEEALAVADRIAVMREGRIEQLSNPVTLYRRPATEFVASFIGQMTLLDGELADSAAGPVLHLSGGVELALRSATTVACGPARCGVRPEQVRLVPVDPAATAPSPGDRATTWEVLRITPRGHEATVLIGCGDHTLTALAPVAAFRIGQAVTPEVADVLIYREGQLCDDSEETS